MPQLDGLRTVAVLLVIGTHTGLIPGGYLGVDVFFVLSGYLITSILLSEHESGRWNVRAFYERRMRRLYPALAVMLLLTAPFDWQLLSGNGSHRIEVVGAAATYTADFFNIHPGAAGGLGHLWSLAVEEQFYLLWPLALLLVLRHRRAGVIGLAAATAGTLALLCAGPAFPMLYSLYARGGVLLIGCLLSLGLRERHVPDWSAIPFAVLLVGLVAVSTDHDAGVSATLVGLATTGLIAGVVRGGLIARLLAWEPLVWVGRRSYGIYLWHLPIVALLTHEQFAGTPNHLVAFVGAVAASSVLSAVSYRYVESRFYSQPQRPARLAYRPLKSTV